MKLRNLEDLDPFERLTLIDMSYSRLNTYEMCKAQYFYNYVYKGEKTFSTHATLGNIIHDVLEEHVGHKLKLKNLLETFQLSRLERDPSYLIPDEMILAGKDMLAEFVDAHSEEFLQPTRQQEVIGKEQAFSFVLGNCLIRGFIDRIDRLSEEKIHIIDYKSGKNQVAQKWAFKDLQLGIYFLACTLLYPEAKEFKAELYYLKTQKMIGHTFTVEKDYQRVLDNLVERLTEVKNDQFFHYTSNSRICSFCDHATSGICPTGVTRTKYSRR